MGDKKIISGRELEPFLHNMLYVEQLPGGTLQPYRFTKAQRYRYAFDSGKLNGNFVPASYTAANVTIDLMTDSDMIGLHFSWCLRSKAIDYSMFDLLIDSKLCDSYSVNKENVHEAAFSLPEGEHRVTIVFPWNGEIKLENIVLSAGASVAPTPARDLKILAFGDSITQGYISRHPSMSYIGVMTRKLNAEVINQGVGGYYFEAGSLDPDLSKWKPDLITIAYGHNDYVFRPDQSVFQTGMETYMERLTEIFPSTPILAIMPIHCCSEKAKVRDLIRDFTEEDSYDVMRSIYGKYPNVTIMEDTYFPQLPEFYAPDCVHPNDMGFVIYGNALADAVHDIYLSK